ADVTLATRTRAQRAPREAQSGQSSCLARRWLLAHSFLLVIQASARGTDAERASPLTGNSLRAGGVITALSCDKRFTVQADRKPHKAAFFLLEIRTAVPAVHWT